MKIHENSCFPEGILDFKKLPRVCPGGLEGVGEASASVRRIFLRHSAHVRDIVGIDPGGLESLQVTLNGFFVKIPKGNFSLKKCPF